MANNFKRKLSSNVGNTFTSVGGYSVGVSTETTVIGLTVSNKTDSQILVDITLDDTSSNTYLIREAPVPSGSSLVVVGGDQKVVLEAGDEIKVTSSEATSADVVVSVLEIT